MKLPVGGGGLCNEPNFPAKKRRWVVASDFKISQNNLPLPPQQRRRSYVCAFSKNFVLLSKDAASVKTYQSSGGKKHASPRGKKCQSPMEKKYAASSRGKKIHSPRGKNQVRKRFHTAMVLGSGIPHRNVENGRPTNDDGSDG